MPPRVKNPNDPGNDDPGWLHYVEPYAGGLAVLLAQDPTGISEVVCDSNRQLTNFWRVLQNERLFRKFRKFMESVPFSEIEYNDAEQFLKGDPRKHPINSAAMFFVRCRQSMSGRMDCFAPVTRNRTRRAMNEQASAWLSAIDGLPEAHQRLRSVLVLEGPALRVIKKQDGPRTLFYLDPPYMKETRTAEDVFEHEMSDKQHENLLDCLTEIEGRFMLSGYRSVLYDHYADRYGWRREEMPIDNKSSSSKTKAQRVECVYMNYQAT